jgi:hypothetical protein
LGLIQERLETDAFLPWFLISTEQSLTLTATNRSVALPADFLREWDQFPVYLYDATQADPYTRLNKDEFDVLESKYAGASGPPAEYALNGVSLEFFPTPKAGATARWKYYQEQAPLSDAILDNAWTANATDLLVAELTTIMAAYKQNDYWSKKGANDIVMARRRLIAFHLAREQESRDATMGDAE